MKALHLSRPKFDVFSRHNNVPDPLSSGLTTFLPAALFCALALRPQFINCIQMLGDGEEERGPMRTDNPVISFRMRPETARERFQSIEEIQRLADALCAEPDRPWGTRERLGCNSSTRSQRSLWCQGRQQSACAEWEQVWGSSGQVFPTESDEVEHLAAHTHAIDFQSWNSRPEAKAPDRDNPM